MPRSAHGEWQPAGDRADPIEILERQAETRVPELVPIRYGRMMVSPATFYRGAAAVMADDLAATPMTGLDTQLCGDAHMLNFGGFASPERILVFDLNDFDETLRGSWELDLKRLVASVEINARERGIEAPERRKMVRGAVREYRAAMRSFAKMGNLATWYSRVDEETILAALRAQQAHQQLRTVRKAGTRARRKDSTRAFEKLTQTTDGVPRIKSDPPLIVPVHELFPDAEADQFETLMRELLEQYTSSLEGDRRRLLERFSYADLARKVVGVGSVGTRCWILLLIGRDHGDPLFLQVKEAQPSVLSPISGESPFPNQGQRVVEGQRMMQASSDIFLGWIRTADTPDEVQRDFYLRQLWDWKVSIEPGEMEPEGMAIYARMCAWTLARAHARSGDAIAIAAYAGSGEQLDRAMAKFAAAYADQNEADHRELLKAVRKKRLKATKGV
ncbi:MAG TPA: DUF2252 domain-containing protein [Solirubrobacteraceae bacterium]|nr:DUF2252 domain-containing protein [Solirubrobacteraceae bacterium]